MKNKKVNIKQSQPLVSVVMPVYNAGEYLVPAIESILNQTYANFEFIIIDDASTDNYLPLTKSYARKDKRIKVIEYKTRQIVPKLMAAGIKIAAGDFIARMDADDIALPQRLEKQVEFLLEHPKTVALGGQCLLINSKGEVTGKKNFPTSYSEVYKSIFEFTPVQEPTMMIAKKRLPKHFVFYKGKLANAEEVELLFKLFEYGRVENLPDVIHLYRIHDNNYSFSNPKKIFFLTLFARLRSIYLYHYIPTARGALITLAQALIVGVLPKPGIIFFYKMARAILIEKTFSLSFFKKIFSANIKVRSELSSAR